MTWPSLLGEVVEHGLQPLLELAAELGAGDQRAHVERQHALVLERLGHFAVDDALREAFDDRGLADARLADQHRVVLGAPLQHLDGAADLVVAADDRVELALARALGQVDGVLLQRLALAFGLLRIRPSAPPRTSSIAASSALRVSPCSLQRGAPVSPLSSASASRNSSLAMNWSPRLSASLSAGCSSATRSRLAWNLAAAAFDLGQAGDERVHRRLQAGDVDARAFEQGPRAVRLGEHRREHVRGLYVGVAAHHSRALGFGQGVLERRREFVESHESLRIPVDMDPMDDFSSGNRHAEKGRDDGLRSPLTAPPSRGGALCSGAAAHLGREASGRRFGDTSRGGAACLGAAAAALSARSF